MECRRAPRTSETCSCYIITSLRARAFPSPHPMLRVNPLHRKHLHQIHARPTEFMQQKTVETRTTHCRDGEKKTRQRMVPPILLVIQFQWCSARSTRVGSFQNGKGPRHFSSVPASTLFETGSGFLELIDHRVSSRLAQGRPDSGWIAPIPRVRYVGSPFDSGPGRCATCAYFLFFLPCNPLPPLNSDFSVRYSAPHRQFMQPRIVGSPIARIGRGRPDSEWFRSYSWRASPMKKM
ncbi:hypothetical protein DFH06DRAFT_1486553 [Mycena polygramma]|nr:hypothetical protein DFH06DRAFT_1486553 [Mycena polygramma]